MATVRRPFIRTSIVLSSLILALSVEAMGQGSHPPMPLDVVGGCASTHIIVKFAPGVLDPQIAKGNRRSSYGSRRRIAAMKAGVPVGFSPELKAAWRRCGVIRMHPLYTSRSAKAAIAERHGLGRTYILEVPTGSDTPALAAEFSKIKDQVEFAEVDNIVQVAAVPTIPNDPDFCEQYGLNNTGLDCNAMARGVSDADIDAPEAWSIHTGNPGTVTIAIIDSGVDATHPEFAGRMVPGWTVNPMFPATEDDCPHGTHVAGIAAATGNNGMGIAGVTWGANIMPVRVFAGASPCGGLVSTVAAGIDWAVNHGADICNLSVQVDQDVSVLKQAVNNAFDNGVLLVSAAGNTMPSGINAVSFPARYANSMAVSATTASDNLASFSNFGNELDVSAPGEGIWSTWPWVCSGGTSDGLPCSDGLGIFCFGGGTCTTHVNTYAFLSGTSQATPLVSGLAALLKSFYLTLTNTELTNIDLRRIINLTADDLGAPGWDMFFGHGRINAAGALQMAMNLPRIFSSMPPDGAIDARQPFDLDGVPQGWNFVDLDFIGDTSGLTCSGICPDFSVLQADGGTPPSVQFVFQSPVAGFMRVILSGPISPNTWTTIIHVPSGTSVRLGFLPGDSDGNRMVDQNDLTFLQDALTGAISLPPIWSVDTDRSGTLSSPDVLRDIDLLGGGGPYAVFEGATLPPPPP